MSNDRKYANITIQTRLKLINRVFKDGCSINSSAKLLKIRPSTAKAIVARYRKTGNVERKKKQMKAPSNQRLQPEFSNQTMSNENMVPLIPFDVYQTINMMQQYSYMNWILPAQYCWNPQMMFY